MYRADQDKVLKDLLKERENAFIRKYCPVFQPEYGSYTVKTTAPYYTTNWKLNFLRRHREEELKDEAMKAARMKCHESANGFTKCSLDHPFEETTICKEIFQRMKHCFSEETEVEMDKRRRDMTRNNEWWWQNIYDENGNIGTQATPPPDTYIEKVVTFCVFIQEKMDGWFYRHDK